jgi:hypothetical protein
MKPDHMNNMVDLSVQGMLRVKRCGGGHDLQATEAGIVLLMVYCHDLKMIGGS